MSNAQNIRDVINKFHEEKTPQILQSMNLEELSEVWQNINADAQAAPADDQASKDEHKARQEGLKKAITPEYFQQKMDDYLVSLSTNDFSVADLNKILEFSDAYAVDGLSDDLKKSLDNLKEKMADKRVTLDKAVDLDPKKIDPAALALQSKDVEDINIEANSEITSSLADKKSKNGKTITFKDKEGQDLAGVEFDAAGHADIMIAGKDGVALHYQMFKDGNFGRVEGDKTRILDKDNLDETSQKAFNYAKDAENVWEQFSEGKLDNAVEKEITVNEGEEEVKVNEGTEKDTTKIDEGKDVKKNPTNTVINQGQEEEEPAEADITGDTNKDKTDKKDEVYWKEGDIIDTMFKEWFLAAANSATNWVVHQIEYAASGVWDEFEKSYRQRKAEREKEQKDAEKSPKTTKLYDDAYAIYDKNMAETRETNTPANIVAKLNEGGLNALIESNPNIKRLYNSSPQFFNEMLSPERLKDPQYAQTCAATLSGFITHVEAFSNKYAATSLLDEQMKDKNAFNNKDINQAFAEKKQIGLEILIKDLQESKEINKDQNLADIMTDSLKRMQEAESFAANDYAKRNFNEAFGKPHKNKILAEFNNLLDPDAQERKEQERAPEPEPKPVEPEPEPKPVEPEPEPKPIEPEPEPKPVEPEPEPKPVEPDPARSMDEEATHESKVEEQQNQQREEADNEGANLEGRQEYIERKRKNLQAYKDGKNKGTSKQAPLLAPQPKNIDIGTLRYNRDGGRK